MKLNYIRVFLLAVIVVMFLSLMTRWQEMFNPAPVKAASSTKTVSAKAPSDQAENAAQKSGQDTLPDSFDSQTSMRQYPPIVINTKVFKDLEISPLNGTIINAELRDYPVSLSDKNPMSLLNNQQAMRYTASGMITLNGKRENVLFKPLSTRKQGRQTIVKMVGEVKGLRLTRTYFIDDQSYAIAVDQALKNTATKPVSVRFDNVITRKINPESHSFSLLNAHSYSFNGIGLSSLDKPFQKESFSDLSDNSPVEVSTAAGWAAMIQHYFLTLWVPDNSKAAYTIYATKLADNLYQAGVRTQTVVLNPSATLSNHNVLYSGPTITKNLEAMVQNFAGTKPQGLNKLVDYGLLSFISVIIFWLMGLIHQLVGNWGVSIILVTVLIKILFYPLSAKSYKSMAKMRMLQPRMKKLQELYKGDRQKLGRKMMEMYKTEKVNPASGCLPILIQIPVFIALYWVLLESVQLRQAPFIFWIHDLSARDPYFILPILMGISMFLQQKISPASADPTQARIMMLMPVIFTVFFASFPSGLVLYWLTNNVISILQQWYITKKYTAIYKAQRG